MGVTLSPASELPTPARHDAIVDRLGLAIVRSGLAEGSVHRAEDLEAEFGASRSSMRECLRVLETLGMVASRRRVGVTVQQSGSWNAFDPRVIGWRLASEGRNQQILELTQLREAIEPVAASLAALRRTPEEGRRLTVLAGEMEACAHADDLPAYLDADIEFHALILRASRNDMFARLDHVVAEQLTGRHGLGLILRVADEARKLHLDTAVAIQRGESRLAEDRMRAIVRQAEEEIEALLGDD
ncbi:FadR/GntR family transcriptional regulator [Mariniluteicoccus flavus]